MITKELKVAKVKVKAKTLSIKLDSLCETPIKIIESIDKIMAALQNILLILGYKLFIFK